MSPQIAIRLPDTMVAFLDQAVHDGRAASRASIVEAALEREIRRLAAEADAEKLRKLGPDDDLDPLVAWTYAQFTKSH